MKVWKLTIAIAFLTVSFLAGCASTFGPGCNCGGTGGGFYQGAPTYGAAPPVAGQSFQPAPFQSAPFQGAPLQSAPGSGGFGGSGGR